MYLHLWFKNFKLLLNQIMSNVKNNFDQNSYDPFSALLAIAIYKPKLGWVRLACARL